MPTFAVLQSGAKIGDLVGADVAELQVCLTMRSLCPSR